jgi:hypothetical protein
MPNTTSPIVAQAEALRKTMLSSNRETPANPYSITHPDALSDGDALGRGEYRGSIGTSDDIKARRAQTSSNVYNEGNEYNVI